MSRHENYEILNLIGYGLAKFDTQFEELLGFNSKSQFYRFLVNCGVAETEGVVKNRQDLFDPFFPNPRAGWHLKGDAYIHRKTFIDSLYGTLSAQDYSEVVSQYLSENYGASLAATKPTSPIQKSRFKMLQETGLEAELFFLHNYESIECYAGGVLGDARLLGDGYDFQISFPGNYFLAEVKGVRAKSGGIRMTEREYKAALEYGDLYSLVVVCRLSDSPVMTAIGNPAKELKFDVQHINSTQIVYCTSKW